MSISVPPEDYDIMRYLQETSTALSDGEASISGAYEISHPMDWSHPWDWSQSLDAAEPLNCAEFLQISEPLKTPDLLEVSKLFENPNKVYHFPDFVLEPGTQGLILAEENSKTAFQFTQTSGVIPGASSASQPFERLRSFNESPPDPYIPEMIFPGRTGQVLPVADQVPSQGLYPNRTPKTRKCYVRLAHGDSAPRTTRKNEKTQGRNKRPANIETFNPSLFYEPLARTPTSWGSFNSLGQPIFRYNNFGELHPKDNFTPEQMIEYLYGDPADNPYKRTLWIQTTPSDSNRRYPYAGSDKCRYQNCPVLGRTIFRGSFRVAFDEHSGRILSSSHGDLSVVSPASDRKTDPFHCAGFVHLYCLEQNTDFPLLCKHLDIQPDNRELPEGPNKMAISRDHVKLFDMVEKYKKASRPGQLQNYEQTLCYQLTAYHLAHEPDCRRKLRQQQDGNHTGIHKGNLHLFRQGQDARRSEKTKALENKKRARLENVEAQSPDDLEHFLEEEGYGSRSIKRKREETAG
ncbi:MAG: hypothetical protein M1818_006577 [Claussenomyces sp. TS43310]|nr:MAG: hypothetical protein M1818_006577 [Claussenomyces sp. TS43310]